MCVYVYVCVCVHVWGGGSILKGSVWRKKKKKRGREEIHLWPENTEDKLRKCCANV